MGGERKREGREEKGSRKGEGEAKGRKGKDKRSERRKFK